MNMVMVDHGPSFASLAPFGLLLIALLGHPIVRRWRAAVFVLLPLAALLALPLLGDWLQAREMLRHNRFGMDAEQAVEVVAALRQQAMLYGALFLAAVALPSLAATADRGRASP